MSLWGVGVTGVGDAVGAAVGVTWGRHTWGRQRRTMEGSLAMLLSLVGVCAILFTIETLTTSPVMGNRDDGNDNLSATIELRQWFPVCVVATLMEAFTLQIDNLVLPLVGVALLLFL